MEEICDQIGMFQMLFSDFKFTKEVREIETFAGYGSQHMSFKRLNDEKLLNSTSWKTVEWEYHAIESYYEVHCSDDKTDYGKDMMYNDLLTFFLDSGISASGKEPMSETQIKRKSEEWMRALYNKIKATHNLVDITKVHSKDLEIVEKDKFQYLLTYSFPCQDLSKAGKQKGMTKGDGTRSGMLWEIERIIGECYRDGCLPDVLLMENVPDVVGSKNMNDFMLWYAALEAVGYQSYYRTLNAKDYTIPQNRDRCFMVSILGNYNYSFPKRVKLDLRLKDILENNVDEKYYLSNKMINFFKNNSLKNEKKGNGFRFTPKDGNCIAKTITTNNGSRMDDNFLKEDMGGGIGGYP